MLCLQDWKWWSVSKYTIHIYRKYKYRILKNSKYRNDQNSFEHIFLPVKSRTETRFYLSMFFCKGHTHSLVYLSSQCSLNFFFCFFCFIPGDHASPEVACTPAHPARAAALCHHGPGSQVAQWRKKHARRSLDTLGYISGSLITLQKPEASSDHVC